MSNERPREPVPVRLLTREEFREATGLGSWKQKQLERAGRLTVRRLGVRTVRIPSTEVERIAREGA